MFGMSRELRHHFGLSPQEPTKEQMKAIDVDLVELIKSKKEVPTEEEIGAIVKKHCKTFQQFKHPDDGRIREYLYE